MRRLGIENLSTFGCHPAQLIRIARETDCGHVSLNLARAANLWPGAPEYVLRDDAALRREVVKVLRDEGISLSLLEGFAITPQNCAADLEPYLDIAADLGARAICTVSLERDLDRSHGEFSRLTEMAAQRGLLTTTEVGAGVLRNLGRSVAAVKAVGHPDFKLLLDTMHFFRSGATLADFAALDPAAIGHVQLCDVPMPAQIEDYMDEALHERRAPGDGDLPLAQFARLVPEHTPIGLEIPIRSEVQAGMDERQRFARYVNAARNLFADA